MDKNELRKKFNISDNEKISTDKFESIMVAREKKEISKDDFINLLIGATCKFKPLQTANFFS